MRLWAPNCSDIFCVCEGGGRVVLYLVEYSDGYISGNGNRPVRSRGRLNIDIK